MAVDNVAAFSLSVNYSFTRIESYFRAPPYFYQFCCLLDNHMDQRGDETVYFAKIRIKFRGKGK